MSEVEERLRRVEQDIADMKHSIQQITNDVGRYNRQMGSVLSAISAAESEMPPGTIPVRNEREWHCKSCEAVLGIFNLEENSFRRGDSRMPHLKVFGSSDSAIQIVCHRCKELNFVGSDGE